MIKNSALIVLSCFILAMVQQHQIVSADQVESVSARTLSIEEAVQYALTNYADIKLSQWKIATNDAQLTYVMSEKTKLEEKKVVAASEMLPVAPEIFIKSIPNYDQLSEEEQASINQSISIQIMINTSLNQLIGAQTDSQNSNNQEQKNSQLKDYSNQLRSLKTDKMLNKLELQKAEALIRYYTVQKYLGLSALKTDIEYDKKENQYWNMQTEDALKLYACGLISKKDLDTANNKARQQHVLLENNLRDYQSQLDQFKQDLGLLGYKELILEEIRTNVPESDDWNTFVNIENNVEIKVIDAKVALAKENYDAIKASDSELKAYYSVIWSSQAGNRTIIQQQLEVKLTGYKVENNQFFNKYAQLLEEHAQLLLSYQDSKSLYTKGLISSSEIGEIELQLDQLNRKMDRLKFEYTIFQEKIDLAVRGVIL